MEHLFWRTLYKMVAITNPRNPNLAPNSILMVLVDLDGSRNDAILEFSL